MVILVVCLTMYGSERIVIAQMELGWKGAGLHPLVLRHPTRRGGELITQSVDKKSRGGIPDNRIDPGKMRAAMALLLSFTLLQPAPCP